MKFSADCKDFYNALNFVQRGIATRTTMPILSNILVEANDKIQLRSTNLVISLQTSFPAQIEKSGSVAISPTQLLSLLAVNSGEVSVSVEKMMSIKVGNSRTRLSIMDASEFPMWPSVNPIFTFHKEKNTLKEIFESVEFAVAKDARRPILTGTYFNAPHKLIVGADGIRMAMVNFGLEGDFAIVIPQQAIEEIKRLTSDEEIMEIQIGEKSSYFKLGNYEIITNHLAGEYPVQAIGRADSIKSREHSVEVKLKKDSLLKVLGIVNTFQTGLISTPLKLTCTNEIVAEIETDAGSYRDIIDGEVMKGQISILLSAPYLMDIANQVKSELILLMGEPHQPILVLDPDNENWSVIQVPIAGKDNTKKWEREKQELDKPKGDDF